MPIKLSQKQFEGLFAKVPKTSKRTPAFFEDEILKLKVGDGGIAITESEWKEITGGKDFKTLPIHYRGKFNAKYENDFLEVKKVGASEMTNNEAAFTIKRVDPTTKTKRKPRTTKKK